MKHRLQLARLWSTAAVVAAVLVLVGGFSAVSSIGVAAARRSAAANRQAARPAAERLLGKLRLPGDARRDAIDESSEGLLAGSLLRVASPNLVDVHRFWRLSGRPCKVMSWIDRHPPAGSRRTASAGYAPDACRPETPPTLPPAIAEHVSSPPTVRPVWGSQFSFPEQPERFSEVALVVEVAPANGGGTALRVDSQIVWTLPRPASERIPTGVEAVLVKVSNPGSHIAFTRMLDDPATIRQIIAIIEGLPASQPGTYSCPADTGKAAVTV